MGPPRRGVYGALTALDVAALRQVCSEVLWSKELPEAYNVDWMRKWRGASECVVLPRSTDETSEVLKYCNENRLAVVPQGGKTGLVGGSVPVFDEIVMSTVRMNEVESIEDGVVRVQAGCVLEDLDSYLQERGFVAPLDLGAKGTCTIGGNASTNAGGLRFLRYGSLRGSVLGLEAVLADGTVLDAGYSTGMRKDNTGLALHQLLIGAEGTLGVVTKVALATPPKPNSVQVALFACDTFDQVRDILAVARQSCGEILSAIEFFDSAARDRVLASQPDLADPLAPDSRFRVLVETSGSRSDHDREKLDDFLTQVTESGLASDGTVAEDSAKAKRLWRLREGISDAMTTFGYVYKYDVSLPLRHMYDVVEETRRRVPEGTVVAGYGHLGDSNLHLNVCSPNGDDLLGTLEPWIFDRVSELDGSISAEHGLGQCKNNYLHLAKSPQAICLMRSLKDLFDPKHILNPYKYLPTT